MRTTTVEIYPTDLKILRKYQTFPNEPYREIIKRIVAYHELKEGK